MQQNRYDIMRLVVVFSEGTWTRCHWCIVRPLSVHIGAEIEGVDITSPLSDQAVREIRAALLRWKVVFFRNQFLKHTQHVQFARQFGDPTPGHVVFGGDDEYPEIYSVAKHRTANQGKPSVKHSWTG